MSRVDMLRRGTVKRLHVDQAVIRQCRKDGTNEPAITIQTSKGPIKCSRATIFGTSSLVQSLTKPLACGARVWIETRARVEAA